MYSSVDFKSLSKAGFSKTYSCIEDAMRYYDSDPGTCCKNFRMALESAIYDIYEILGKDSADANLKSNIDRLSSIIPSGFQKDELIFEMNNVRLIGNDYAHFSVDEKDPFKDRLTCYCAMKKIADWMIMFSTEYPKYLKRKEEKRKIRKEKSKKAFKIIGTIAAGTITVLSAILGIKHSRR